MAAIAAVAMLSVGAGTAQAGEFDCTTGCSVTINGAFFTTTDNQSTGTGVIQSFVRIQANGDEDGHNTSGRPLANDEQSSPQFTRNLQVSEVPIVVNPTGAAPGSYYEFLLDINQSSGGDAELLSLDEIIICTSNSGGLVESSAGANDGCPSGTIAYSLDLGADNWLKLDYSLNSGSGSGDLFMYVPTSFFGAGSFVYLYSAFGTHYVSNDGFEEWAVRSQTPLVPEPATMLLFGLGIAGGVARARRRAKQA